MEKNTLFDVDKARIYKKLYRPSTNVSSFLRTIWSIIVVGNSPISRYDHYSGKKTKY